MMLLKKRLFGWRGGWPLQDIAITNIVITLFKKIDVLNYVYF